MYRITTAIPLILAAAVLSGACDRRDESAADSSGFVTVHDGRFMLDDRPYRFVGTNMWYAAYIGRAGDSGGDRERLLRELDLLKASGVDNLRILGAAERSPLRDSMRPAISFRGEVENEEILRGLDFALSEMAKRNMKAVIYLNNFWEWSGGMATYLSWVNGGEFIDMSDPDHPWPAFAQFTSQFYANEEATALYDNYVSSLLNRRNSVTGKLYRNDPTIMSWQLANEPRPGDGEIGRANLEAYYRWIRGTAQLIRELAPQQLISVGSEGTMGCLELDECFIAAHSGNAIDYATFHMWLKNWSWFDVQRPEETYPEAVRRATLYIDRHVRMAERLGMPIVLEEFGVERDYGSTSPESSVEYRNRFYEFVFNRVEENAAGNGPLMGTNFWAWGGFGEAAHADAVWREGDESFVGDPPQEPQGLNSVFASDDSTLEILRDHAGRLRRGR